jgi:hypothetical protein
MSTPKRVKVIGDRFHGRVPDDAVYVGRAAPGLPASRFHNPYQAPKAAQKAGQPPRRNTVDGETVEVRDRPHAVELFRGYLRRHPDLVEAARQELAGRDLCCWCPLPAPGEPDICHAALLITVAAGAEP